MKPIQPLHELVAAAHSPFHGSDRSLAPEVVATQAAFFAANGVRTVFITGSTGECHSLTCAERLDLYDAWASAAPAHGIAVIAHVGGNSIDDARALARRARTLELSAFSALAPSYYKPATLDDLIDWCAAIAAEAPELPFYYYSIPVMTGVSLPMERFLVEAPARIPNFAGIKFTNTDLVSYRRSLDVGRRSLRPAVGCRRSAVGCPGDRRSRRRGIDLQLGAQAVHRSHERVSPRRSELRLVVSNRYRSRWLMRSPRPGSWAPRRP